MAARARSRETGGWIDSIGVVAGSGVRCFDLYARSSLGFRAGPQGSGRVVRAAPLVQSAVRCLRVKIPRREVEWPHRSVSLSVRAPNLWPARTCRSVGLGVPHRTAPHTGAAAADGSSCAVTAG
jgi:hypothetical protein